MQMFNLLNGLPKKEKFFLTYRVLVVVLQIWAVFLVALYGYYFWENSKSNDAVAQMTKKSKAAKDAMLKISLAAKGEKEEEITKRIKDLDKLVKEKQMIVSYFKKDATTVPSTYLKTIADKIPSGVWLKRLLFSPPDKLFTLEGYTMRPPLVMHFAHELDKLPVFDKYEFTVSNLQKQKNTNYYDFMLSTQYAVGKVVVK